MNRSSSSYRRVSISAGATFSSLIIVCASLLASRHAAAASKSLLDDQSAFASDAALLQRDAGSPVGPVVKIIICHNGHSIRVAERAVPAHLAHGDTLGQCPGDQVVCRNGVTHVTASPRPNDVPGPCPNDVFMCNLRLRMIVVDADRIPDHLARGQHLGLCPGKNLICHRNHTIIVPDSDVPFHLAHGDTVGYCLGGQGPLVPPQ